MVKSRALSLQEYFRSRLEEQKLKSHIPVESGVTLYIYKISTYILYVKIHLKYAIFLQYFAFLCKLLLGQWVEILL